jgi:hypothetical protein
MKIRNIGNVTVVCLLLAGCGRRVEEPVEPQDAPLSESQAKLLQTAFDAASAIPLEPHIQSRSEAQEKVINVCLEMDQPVRVQSFITDIANWRRGTVYANLAFYYAENGRPDLARQYLQKAEQFVTMVYDWPKERINAHIARVHAYMRNTEKAAHQIRDVEAVDKGLVSRSAAQVCTPEEFEEQMRLLESIVASDRFDVVRQGLIAYTELFNTFYHDRERRDQIEAKLLDEKILETLPGAIVVDLYSRPAHFAVQQGDTAEANRWLDKTRELYDTFTWNIRFGIPFRARLAKLRAEAGDPEAALDEAESLRALYREEKAQIANIYWAETITPVAEVFLAAGDNTRALEIYMAALDAAVENPNSRPRAEDLSAICLSMAENGAEPDEALWNRLNRQRSNLGDPW